MLLQTIGLSAVLMAPAGAPPPPVVRLDVHISDWVPVPTANLQKAIAVTHGILSRAGIEASWSISHPDFNKPGFAFPQEVPIRIIPKSPAWAKETFFGATGRNKEGGGLTIGVFYEQINGNRAVGGDRSVFMGMVMAHEIGHFFGLHHSMFGIMVSNFEPSDILRGAGGSLGFLKGQALDLRKAITQRQKESSRTKQ